MRQDDTVAYNHNAANNTAYPPGAVKPVAYYGEGDFDPPSSDDEEDAFLEKSLSPKSPGEAERLGDGAVEDDGELVVGGQVQWLICGACR